MIPFIVAAWNISRSLLVVGEVELSVAPPVVALDVFLRLLFLAAIAAALSGDLEYISLYRR